MTYSARFVNLSAVETQLCRKQGNQIEKLKSSGKKSDDVGFLVYLYNNFTHSYIQILSTAQSLLQCQICLELLLKPFAFVFFVFLVIHSHVLTFFIVYLLVAMFFVKVASRNGLRMRLNNLGKRMMMGNQYQPFTASRPAHAAERKWTGNPPLCLS